MLDEPRRETNEERFVFESQYGDYMTYMYYSKNREQECFISDKLNTICEFIKRLKKSVPYCHIFCKNIQDLNNFGQENPS